MNNHSPALNKLYKIHWEFIIVTHKGLRPNLVEPKELDNDLNPMQPNFKVAIAQSKPNPYWKFGWHWGPKLISDKLIGSY